MGPTRRPCAEARQSARTKDHGRRAMEGEGEGGEGLKIAEFRRGELDRHHIVPACARAREPSRARRGWGGRRTPATGVCRRRGACNDLPLPAVSTGDLTGRLSPGEGRTTVYGCDACARDVASCWIGARWGFVADEKSRRRRALAGKRVRCRQNCGPKRAESVFRFPCALEIQVTVGWNYGRLL